MVTVRWGARLPHPQGVSGPSGRCGLDLPPRRSWLYPSRNTTAERAFEQPEFNSDNAGKHELKRRTSGFRLRPAPKGRKPPKGQVLL